jgi:hypothetical protein
MSERSEGYRKTSVKPCGFTSWPQTREMLPRRAHWLVLMEPGPHQNDARIAMQLGRTGSVALACPERFFNKIKQCRRVATRYNKLATNYLAFVKLASIRIWLLANESAALVAKRNSLCPTS